MDMRAGSDGGGETYDKDFDRQRNVEDLPLNENLKRASGGTFSARSGVSLNYPVDANLNIHRA